MFCMLLNKKREKLPCHAVPTIRMLSNDDAFIESCNRLYPYPAVIMILQQLAHRVYCYSSKQ
jgi:hypothetical protein